MRILLKFSFSSCDLVIHLFAKLLPAPPPRDGNRADWGGFCLSHPRSKFFQFGFELFSADFGLGLNIHGYFIIKN